MYLPRFDRPFGHARHYTGPTTELDTRLDRRGAGGRLAQVVAQAGIGPTLARTWPASRTRERQLKRQGGASRRCPICRAERARP